jgi:alpha-tubulin suppressor-like RCC1 family protein
VNTVAAGYAHSVFLIEDGSVLTSGWNHYGQLGHSSTADSNPPDYVDPFYPPGHVEKMTAAVAEVSAENATTAATTAAPTPAPSPKAVAIAAGYDFTYILGENGDLWTVGNNLGGQLGFSDGKSRSKAEIALSGVDKIAAGESHGIFLMKDGNAKGTGANFAGQLGDSTFKNKFSPEPILNLNGAKDVAAGGDGSCFAEYQLRCCGSNLLGQLGLRDQVFVALPESVEEVDLADDMAPGTTHSLFLNHADVVITGANVFGQLGDNDTDKILRKPEVERRLARSERTTTAAPPTPAPTPSTLAPSPGTPPVVSTPGPTREPRNPGPGLDWPWQMLVGGIVSGLAVVVVVVCIFDRQPAQVGESVLVTQSMELRQHEPVVV